MKHRWRNIGKPVLTIVGAIILVGAVFLTTPITEKNNGFDSDGRRYGVMAGETSFPFRMGHEAPWCYRILTPYLASLLPFQTLTNFLVLSFFSNILSIIILALILDSLCFPLAYRLFGIFLYAGSFWTLKFSFYSPAYIDYLTQLLLLLIIYCTIRKTYILLILIFIVAGFQKESLAAYSVFSVLHILRNDTKSPIRTRIILVTTVLAIPFATVLVVWLAVDPLNAYSPTVMVNFFLKSIDPRFWPVMLQALFSGVGIIPILLLVNYETWIRFIRLHWEWAAYAIISLSFLFGGSDKARLFLYILPLLIILTLYNVEGFTRYASSAKLIVWGCFVLAVHLYIGGYLSEMGTFSGYLARMVPEHSGGNYVPYLIRNLCLGLVIFIFTIWFIIKEWYFRPTIGFTRRDTVEESLSKPAF